MKVGVLEGRRVDGSLDVVEPPLDDALQGYRQRAEGMRHHGVPPVDDAVVARVDEELAIVQVVVLKGLLVGVFIDTFVTMKADEARRYAEAADDPATRAVTPWEVQECLLYY